MRMPVPVVAVLLVALIAPSAAAAGEPGGAFAAAASYTIKPRDGYVVRIGPFRPRRDPSVGAAERAFGAPSSRRERGGSACVVRWSSIRLKILFVNLGAPGESTCAADIGRAQSFAARGKRFVSWKGLRVGDRSSTIRDRHPVAERRRRGWWLRSAVSPFGDGSRYAVVRAAVSGRRVSALTGWIGAAGE